MPGGKAAENDGQSIDERLERIEGSHHIMTHPKREEALSVPVHGSHSLKIGQIKGILRTAGISAE